MAGSGLFEGENPVVYSASNPLTLFMVQCFIIVVFCRIIHYPLSFIRQPKVIGEVIGGIIIGMFDSLFIHFYLLSFI